MKLSKNFRQLIMWFLAFMLIAGIYNIFMAANVEKEIPYSEFKSRLKNGEVKKVLVAQDIIKGEIESAGKKYNFKTIALNDPNLIKDMEEAKVENFSGVMDKGWITSLLLNIGWILIFVLAWWFIFFRQAQMGGKQAMSFGKSRARQQDLKVRALEILKMRGTKHSDKICPFKFSENGIVVFPKDSVFGRL